MSAPRGEVDVYAFISPETEVRKPTFRTKFLCVPCFRYNSGTGSDMDATLEPGSSDGVLLWDGWVWAVCETAE